MSTPQLTTVIDKAFLVRLCADAICNLDAAIAKHPEFPKLSELDIEEAQKYMMETKRLNDRGDGNLNTIAFEEQMEFEVAVLKGHGPQAYSELVDLITVWLRAGLHLKDYVSREGAKSAEVKP